MSIAVSSTEHDATAARLGRGRTPGDDPPHELSEDEEAAAAVAIARACRDIRAAGDVGAFATPAGRGAYLRDAVRGALAEYRGAARNARMSRMNCPEFLP
jgi:hypothetical protein